MLLRVGSSPSDAADMTNHMHLDMSSATWQEVADFVTSLRPVAAYNSIGIEMKVRPAFRGIALQLVRDLGLEDYIAIEPLEEARKGPRLRSVDVGKPLGVDAHSASGD